MKPPDSRPGRRNDRVRVKKPEDSSSDRTQAGEHVTGDAAGVMRFDEVLADAGYDSEANHRFCRERLGVHSLIPAKKRRSLSVVATTPYRLEMHRLLNDPGDEASKRAYRQRWKVETVLSVTKRRWGEETQRSQALLRGVVYNINRLVLLGYSP